MFRGHAGEGSGAVGPQRGGVLKRLQRVRNACSVVETPAVSRETPAAFSQRLP